MKILISGHNGFVGRHLLRNFKSLSSNHELVFLTKSDFDSKNTLLKKINYSEFIFHFAGVNRDKTDELVYQKNIDLNQKLHDAIQKSSFQGKLVFTSSVQEKLKTKYGESKRISRLNFVNQSKDLGYKFYGLITPNIFGPFCKPNYNSFISSFSQKLINEEKIDIKEDKLIPLIYIDDFIKEIIKLIDNDQEPDLEKHTCNYRVSEVLTKLKYFNSTYISLSHIPDISSSFDKALFNTFRSYIDYKKFFPRKFKLNVDDRGNFSEILRSSSGGQTSFSTTNKGVTRGNHFHTRKIERFSVIKGKAKIQIRDIISKNKIEFILEGKNPSFVDMPIWYTHNIKNIGSDELVTIFWINEHYNENDSDTFLEKV